MKSKEDKIRKHDDGLLRREKSWRRARLEAIFMSIITILSMIVVYNELRPLENEKPEELIIIIIGVLFWPLIVSYLNLQVRHIDSIKLYRTQEESTKPA